MLVRKGWMSDALSRQNQYQRIVVKFGTSVLTGGTPRLDLAHMVELNRQCAEMQKQESDVIIISSGAIAVEHERLGFSALVKSVTIKQLIAAVLQSRLMLAWERLF